MKMNFGFKKNDYTAQALERAIFNLFMKGERPKLIELSARQVEEFQARVANYKKRFI